MKEYNLDLHLHGLHSGGVSKNMTLPVIAEQSVLKGTNVLVTGDITHKKWLDHVKKNLEEESNGVYTDLRKNCHFIIGTELEDSQSIHHLAYLPSIGGAEELREKLFPFGNLDGVMCGRPKLRLTPEQLAEKVDSVGGILGPAHAFTPYTGIYAKYDSLKEAYASMHEKLLFLELGLSADSGLADTVSQNHGYSFLSNSDSHSPWPLRIGREFNRVKMRKPDFASLKKALEQKEEKLITLNAGLDPREGKYHATACNSCFSKYSLEHAEHLNWRCTKCRGQIKRGVRDRIKMLSTENAKSPGFRPRYMHMLPLAEIIQQAVNTKGINTVAVQSKWRDFVDAFGNEISALLDAKQEELEEVDKNTAENIIAFRNSLVLYIPGGGGEYGRPIICKTREEYEGKKLELKNELLGTSDADRQRTLNQFQ